MKRFATILLAVLTVIAIAAIGQTPAPPHSVTVSWTASPDTATDLTYNVWRTEGTTAQPCPAGGASFPFTGGVTTKIASALTTTTFTDTNVVVGHSYCYEVTAFLTNENVESAASNSAGGTIPLAPASGVTVTVH